MTSYLLVMPGEISLSMSKMVQALESVMGEPERVIEHQDGLPEMRNQKLVFAVELNQVGHNEGLYAIFKRLYERGLDSLSGASAIIFIASSGEYYTKSVAHDLIFLANNLGCSFMGHPLIEVTEGHRNLLTWQRSLNIPLEDIPVELSRRQGKRFLHDNSVHLEVPRVLALHASSRQTSNTVMLWDMIKEHFPGKFVIDELNVENGMVLDCRGCSFKECIHYSKQNSCFYGGVVVKEIFPAIEKADVFVWICPNYNDAISANLMAVINRMTALYRKTDFYRKTLFSVIVSGNSGSDSVAKQLIGALNINKGFRLPPYFAVTATANDPGTIKKVPGIEEKARNFAKNMIREVWG